MDDRNIADWLNESRAGLGMTGRFQRCADSFSKLAEVARRPADTNLAAALIATGTTTQPAEIVIAVLAATRGGMSINAAAKASGINYRTAQRIVEGAAKCQPQLAAVG